MRVPSAWASIPANQTIAPRLNALSARVLTRQFDVVVERDAEGYFVATVPRLLGCHTQARSLDQLMERVREAIELYLVVEGEPSPASSWGLKPSG